MLRIKFEKIFGIMLALLLIITLCGCMDISAPSDQDNTSKIDNIDKIEYVTITWKDEDGKILKTDNVKKGELPVYNYTKPSKVSDAKYTYEFSGWTPTITVANANTTYTATYKKTEINNQNDEDTKTYVITWKNSDGKVLGASIVKKGELPVYNFTKPSKVSDGSYTYEFSGWTPTITVANSNSTYTATYKKTEINNQNDEDSKIYIITWKDEDGNTLRTAYAESGKVPSYGKNNPTKESDENYEYTFDSWYPIIKKVDGDATYTAKFSRKEIKKDEDKTWWDKVKDKTGEIIGNITDKTTEIFNNLKEKTIEIFDSFKNKVNPFITASKQKLIELYGTSKDAVIYVYNESANFTIKTYDKAVEKANELVGDCKEYINDLQSDEVIESKYAKNENGLIIRDFTSTIDFDPLNLRTSCDNEEIEQFVAYYISSNLSALGYSVYNGAVYYKGNIYGGLIFTKGETFVEEEGTKIESCGFIQLVSSGYTGFEITDNIVNTGLVAISTKTKTEASKSFMVTEFVNLDSFSGIYDDKLFIYKQRSNYVIDIEIKENVASNYNKNIELYDFDNDKYIWEVNTEKETEELYYSNNNLFAVAKDTVNSIAEISESDTLNSVIVLTQGKLEEIVKETNNDNSKLLNYLKGKTNQFNSFIGSNNVDMTRVTDGIISAVGSGLATSGMVATVVITCVSGSIVIKAIVITTATSAIVYNVSNMIEGIQDIYYGVKDTSNYSENPVLSIFKSIIKDDDLATTIYHFWGIANGLIANLSLSINKALQIAKCKGLNVYETAVSVIRASVTQIGKALATGIGAKIVCNYVNKITTKVSNNENLGKLVGFGTSLVAGMLIYKGLDTIDKELNISGLYPKSVIKQRFLSERSKSYSEYDMSDELDYYEQIRLGNKISGKIAGELGLENPPKVEYYFNSDRCDCGYYNKNSNVISINLNSETNHTLGGLAETIVHEARHAYQYQSGDSVMLNSLNNYISPKPDYSNYNEYRYQICEADAYAYEVIGKRYIQSLLSLGRLSYLNNGVVILYA